MLLVSGQSNLDQPPRYSLQLDPAGHFKIEWSLDYSQEIVKFHLTAKISRHSWFAVGFSDHGEVTSADLLVFWADAIRVNHLVDAHTDQRGILYPDNSQDYQVTAVSSHIVQGEGHLESFLTRHPGIQRGLELHRIRKSWYATNIRNGRSDRYIQFKGHHRSRRIWRGPWRHSDDNQVGGEGRNRRPKASFIKLDVNFQRKFRTCDREDYALDNGTTHVIYIEEILTGDTPLGQSVTSLRHGVQKAQILKPEVVQPPFPDDTWTFEVRAPKISVPASETTYWWHTTRLPDIPQRHHIIKYEGVIAPGSEDLVHHMEVFHCVTHKGSSIPYFSGPGLGEGKPQGLGVCRHVIGAWAMGAQAMVYPEQAGVPVGGSGFSRYVLLEIHYNNPYKKSGIVDTSGIRFYVTSHLRQFEAGIMELGLEYTNKMAVPPGQKRFSLSGYCVPGCTAKGLPPRGIHVFASQLHTHLTGRRVITRHVTYSGSDVTERSELNRDDHYSSHFQEIRRLEPPVTVMPGDALITTCDYDTRGRTSATVGGFSISDEMCVNYIHYYPKTDLEVCKSSVETKALDTFLFLLNRISGANVSPAMGYRASYTNIEWTAVTTDLLDQLYATSPLSMQCNASDGGRLPGHWSHTPIPKLPGSTAQPIQLDNTKC
ncbi:hypothetical protein RRG08_055517 [Elysia crispata]|uniref:DOMON domain-containing protein n=1 Tax=Elysia crispata TaxID=231223 RepID=A0AAE1APG4_9GAST|nr:hypothetical protein RRG08_055517 [Elysia crispata]